MIVLNRQSNQHVSEPRVRNFFPKNPPRSSQSISSSLTASQENFFRTTSSFKKQTPNPFYSPKQSTSPSLWMQPTQYQQYPEQINPNQKWEQLQALLQPQQQLQSISLIQQYPSLTERKSTNNSLKQEPNAFFQQQTEDLGPPRDKLNEQRKNRRDMEESVDAIKNRVGLLQLEEQKTLQKMMDTQKKTIEIIANKTGHMQKLFLKNEDKLRQAEDIVKRQMELKQMREEKKERDDLMKKMRTQSAQMQVQRIKHLKNQYSVHQQLMQQEMLMRKTNRYQVVKQSEREIEMKRQMQMDQKKQLAHQIYTSKCKTEISKKLQSEGIIGDLEKREQELIKKLQFSQNMQQSALVEMQRATKIPSSIVPAKYSPQFRSGNDPHIYFLSES